MLRAVSLLGLLAFVAVAWLLSTDRRRPPWRTILWGLALQLAIGAVVFLVPGVERVLGWANDAVLALLAAAQRGAHFVFGPLALGPGQPPPPGTAPSIGFVLATQVLPAAIFFSALSALAYRLGLVQPLVRGCAWVFQRSLRISGAEALTSAANLFVGVESALAVRPYLERMTRSELLVLLSAGMATVSSSVLGFYVSFFRDQPWAHGLAGHLIAASFIAVPAAIVVAKVLLPEDGTPATSAGVPRDSSVPREDSAPVGGVMAAVMNGAMEGLRLVAGIAAGLIALLGLVALADALLAVIGGWCGAPQLSLAWLLGWAFRPAVIALGLPMGDWATAAEILGLRLVQTEVPAYIALAQVAGSGAIAPRSALVLSYALCGFAHVASLAIFVGGTAALVPARAQDLAALGGRALLAATLATLMTGAVAGVFAAA